MKFWEILKLLFKSKTHPTKLANNISALSQLQTLSKEIKSFKNDEIKGINKKISSAYGHTRPQKEFENLQKDFIYKMYNKQIVSFFSFGIVENLWNKNHFVYSNPYHSWKIINFSKHPHALFVGGEELSTLESMRNSLFAHYYVNQSKTLYLIACEEKNKKLYKPITQFENVIFPNSNEENSSTRVKQFLNINNSSLEKTFSYLEHELKIRTNVDNPRYEIVVAIENIDEVFKSPKTQEKLIHLLRYGPAFKIFIFGTLKQGHSNYVSLLIYDYFKNIFVFKTSKKESQIILQCYESANIPEEQVFTAKTNNGETICFLNLSIEDWIKAFKTKHQAKNFSHLKKIL